MKTKKSRCFTIVLYPDSLDDLTTLEYITSNFDFAYILHDRDIFLKDVYDKDHKLIHKAGDKKKPHYHVLFYFPNPRSLDKIKEELKVDYLEPSSFYSMCRYLCHIDNKNKAQYSVDLITTNMPDRVFTCFNKEINSSLLDSKLLIDYLKSKQYNVSFTQLIDFALKNDCLNELKKNSYFYRHLCIY